MKLRSEIKAQAKAGFMAQYGVSVGALLLVILITSTLSVIYSIINFQTFLWHGFSYSRYIAVGGAAVTLSQLSFLMAIFLYPPIIVGYSSFALRIYRGQQGDISDMFRTSFFNYWRKVGGMLWMYLFTFLWSLLFVIPGIVKALAYFMTPYILAECPNVTATDALKLSMRMTYGYKGEIFVMGLSFIGWAILSGLTFGILGILYTGPYMGTSFAGLYDELKRNALERGVVRPEEFGIPASI
jgi:uncharacterized membrane protein